MHAHSHLSRTQKQRRLLFALMLTASFLIAEVIGGILTKSLALLSDAAHMLTDLTALILSLLAIQITRKAADKMRTFGYYRFEILAAALNTMLLFLVAIYIVYEAYARLKEPPYIQSIQMLIIATGGLVVNLASMKLLSSGKEQSLNIKSVYLEVWSDMLGSIGVIIGALLIQWTEWLWIDSVVAILIGVWVLPRAWVLFKESMHVLLEGVPKEIDLNKMEKALLEIEGITNIHELHVWAITNDKICFTAHVVIDEKYDCEEITNAIRVFLGERFGIYHTTLQHERTKCLSEGAFCHFSHS